jgi:tetratricopeptide (TPR) repeat protein
LAKAYRGLGREEEGRKALARFSALHSRSKDELEARREAARLIDKAKPLVDEGKLSDAIVLLEKAYRLDPKNPQLLFRLASLHYDMKHYEAARQHVGAALDLTPSEWLYHYLLGLIEKASGSLERARESLETAVRLNPSAAEAFNELGDVAMHRQDFANAIRNFENAARLDPRDTAYQLNLQAARLRMAPR